MIKQGILVEQALSGLGIYLSQAIEPNDRFKNNPNRTKVLVELPDTGFKLVWDVIYFNRIQGMFREEGFGHSDARQAAKRYIGEMRDLNNFQMPDAHPRAQGKNEL